MVSPPHNRQAHQFLLPRTASAQRDAEKRFEQGLTALSNMPDWPFPIPDTVGADDWPFHPKPSESDKYIKAFEYYRLRFPEIFKDQSPIALTALRDLVRKTWTTADRRHAEWYLFQVRRIHEDARRIRETREPAELSAILKGERHRDRHLGYLSREAQRTVKSHPEYARSAYAQRAIIKGLREAQESGPPALTSFEEVIFHLQQNLHRAHYCKNPSCTTPYFFLTTKGHKGQGQEYCSADCVGWGKREKNKLWARKNREKDRKRRR